MPVCDEQRTRWLVDNVLPHEPALRAWLGARLRGRLGEHLEVDDVVQETWAVLAGLESVDGVRNPRAYLYTVARSVILQHLRRARIVSIEAVADIDQLPIAEDAHCPERRLAAHQELRRLAERIAALPAKCREAFTLRKVHGLSQREIARRMGISENTVEKHIGKGLRLLMRTLAAEANAAAQTGETANEGGVRRHDRTAHQRED